MIDDALLRPFVEQLRREAFALDARGGGPERVGAEVEFIPVHDGSGRIAPIESRTTGPAEARCRCCAPWRRSWRMARAPIARKPALPVFADCRMAGR